MFTNRTVPGVAMLFSAVILAHPGPGFASSHVDKAMGVVSSPVASKGIIIVNGKQMSFKVGAQPPEILVHHKDVIEFPYASGDQMLFLIDGDHLVIQFPGELGFLTLLNFQKYLTDPDTAAHIEWGLGGKTIASVEDVFSQLSPAAGGTEGLTGIVPEAGEVTAGGSRDAANTFGDPQFDTPFDLNVFDPGPQERTAPALPKDDEPIIIVEEPPPDDGKAIAQADVDKAMGIVPTPPPRPAQASKGIALPGQNVGMEQIGDPDDERSAKGASPPNNLGGAASKLPVPMPPGIAPAGKALQGLNRGPATEASQGLGRTYGRPVPEPPVRPK